MQGPLWSVAAALPVLGDTTTAVQAVATSLDEALTALAPTVDLLGALDPDTLVAADGTIDVAALESAVEPLESARVGVAAAAQTLTTAPSRAAGDRVLGRVDEAGAELAGQLGDLDGTLAGAIEAAQLVPPLLGADGPKRYFVALLNPNEARGTGGLMGNYLIISADSGRITVEEVGSNGDLPNVPYTPPELGAQFIKRYESGPRLVPNLNISPHHPAAGLLWQKSWQEKTGEVLDGAISADVVALGDLLTATGEQVTLPDGGSLSGAELTDFALTGIYEKFPAVDRRPRSQGVPGSRDERRLRPRHRLLRARRPGRRRSARPSASAASRSGRPTRRCRSRCWTPGSAARSRCPSGHHVAAIAINASGSKLDTFLERSLTYEVGRCPSSQPGRVDSVLSVGLTNAVPEGASLPDYVVGLAERRPDGPVNRTLAQLYLPMGAKLVKVSVDGKPASYSVFREQDRLALVLPVELPPRQERTIRVEFSEPADDGPGSAPSQPLVGEQQTTIIDRDCDATDGP